MAWTSAHCAIEMFFMTGEFIIAAQGASHAHFMNFQPATISIFNPKQYH